MSGMQHVSNKRYISLQIIASHVLLVFSGLQKKKRNKKKRLPQKKYPLFTPSTVGMQYMNSIIMRVYNLIVLPYHCVAVSKRVGEIITKNRANERWWRWRELFYFTRQIQMIDSRAPPLKYCVALNRVIHITVVYIHYDSFQNAAVR